MWDNEVIEVVFDPELRRPVALIWKGQTHEIVRMTNRWSFRRKWEHRAIHDDYYKVLTDKERLLVLRHDRASNCWFVTHSND